MTQGNKAAILILLGYLVITTMNGNLRTWLEILGLKGGV